MGSLAAAEEVVASATARTWATDEEILAACELDAELRGVRFFRSRAQNVVAVYNAHRKRLAIGGDGTSSTRQLARDLYPDVGSDLEAWRRKRYSVKRWLDVLERQGLIAKSELRGVRGGGKSLGLRLDFLAVPVEVSRRASQRGCSSAGSSVRIRLPRRQLCPQEAEEARVRPWCPRAGRGTPTRWKGSGPFFSPLNAVPPVGPGGGALKGLSPPGPFEDRSACARGAPGRVSIDASGASGDASPPADGAGEGAEAVAAVRALKAAIGEGGFEALQRAEGTFEAFLGPPAAGRLASLPTIRGLLWALGRLDRYGDFGRGRTGVGLDLLEQLLEQHAWAVRYDGANVPRHLGYFVPALRATARRWKHTWAPRIKAQRREAKHGPASRRSAPRARGG